MPGYHTLIAASELRALLGAGGPVCMLDCRFDLAAPGAGFAAYKDAHIPGAHYAHLDDDLSGPARPGFGGRHPLPDEPTWRARMAGWAITPETQVVAYDATGGCFAARAWWLLRHYGHPQVAVLDVGWAAWSEPAAPAPAQNLAVDASPSSAVVRWANQQPDWFLVDARDPPRYRGELEPIDPVAGHIPGAVNHPWKENLTPDGRFLPAPVLRERWLARLGGAAPDRVVCYCGSGVTACHNLLALEIAGLAGANLYAGSWSEYCADTSRPTAQGDA